MGNIKVHWKQHYVKLWWTWFSVFIQMCASELSCKIVLKCIMKKKRLWTGLNSLRMGFRVRRLWWWTFGFHNSDTSLTSWLLSLQGSPFTSEWSWLVWWVIMTSCWINWLTASNKEARCLITHSVNLINMHVGCTGHWWWKCTPFNFP
jgi:hypothetical protein